jgi:uncharacterized protein YcbX
MSVTLAHITRHPIKAHGREDLASVRLCAGQGLPWDRHWAVAHEAAKLVPGWNPCQNFTRGAKAPGLMAITARLDESTARVTLCHPDLPDLTFAPDDPADLPGFLAWVAPLMPAGRAAPARIITAGRILSDSDFPSVAILNLASNRALSQRMGMALDRNRWRGNLWLDGLAPWQEFDLVGRRLRLGDAVLRVVEPITRCTATTANPATGKVDADTLGALEQGWGHRDFGVYAVVETGGDIATRAEVHLT